MKTASALLLVGFVFLFGSVQAPQATAAGIAANPPEKDSSHVGANPGTPDGREGGETWEDAIRITSFPFADVGNTSDNIDDYDEVCPYTGSDSPDVVYICSRANYALVDIDLCTSLYDTKVYVYEDYLTPGQPYACNDDADCNLPYRSALIGVELYAAHNYYIVIDGYGGDAGDYILNIHEYPIPPPCVPECPEGSLIEGEPLYDGYVDNFNGGCTSDPYAFLSLADDTIFCGTHGWWEFEGEDVRDTDWFSIIAGNDGFISWTVQPELFYNADMIVVTTDCDNLEYRYTASTDCFQPVTIEFLQPAGTEAWLLVQPDEDSDHISESNYIMTITGIGSPQSPVEEASWGAIKTKFK